MNRVKTTAFWAGVVILLTISGAHAWPVPDTGQTQSYTNTFGEDHDYTINSPSYTKLADNGTALPDDAVTWAMVRDNVAGLIWEMKDSLDLTQDYDNPHDADNTYTWYDNNSATNGGDAGMPGAGTDTLDFIDALNAANYGGHNNWHLPTPAELLSIANFGVSDPAVDSGFFPNTQASAYWSSTTSAASSDSAWEVEFSFGNVEFAPKTGSMHVRAVCSEQSGPLAALINNGNGTVTDNSTGLMWQQASSSAPNWELALSYCENLPLAGYTDWRLPTIKELQSIVDYSLGYPAVDPTIFPGTQEDYFWSSTTWGGSLGYALSVDFGLGFVSPFNKGFSGYIRAVRRGIPGVGDLSVVKSGAGAGTVTGASGAINCGSACAATFDNGTTIALHATPDSSSNFDGWSGGGCSGLDTCTIKITGYSATVTAAFSLTTSTSTSTIPPIAENGDAGDTCATAQEALLGTIVEGSMNSWGDEADVYSFVVAQRSDILIYTSGSGKNNFMGRLYDGDCSRIDSYYVYDPNEPQAFPIRATLNPGTYYIACIGPAWLPPPNQYTLHIAVAGKITGRVTDEDGHGIAGVGVDVRSWETGTQTADTGDNGTYIVTGLSTGDYTVGFNPGGQNYFQEWYNDQTNYENADPVSVTEGQITSGINAQLATGSRIVGRVTNDVGQGIVGVSVELYDANTSYDALDSVQTDDNGTYAFMGVATGSYRIRFAISEYLYQWYNNKGDFNEADTAQVTSGQTTSGINAVFARDGSITGRVTVPGSLQGIGGVEVMVEVGGGVSVTDDNGTYTIAGLPPGEYQGGVHFQYCQNLDDCIEQSYNGSFTVIAGQTTSGIDAELALSGIAGRVTDPEGHGIGGIQVTAYILDGDYVSAYTSSDGYYLIITRPGEYMVYFQERGIYAGEWYNDKAEEEDADLVMVDSVDQITTGIDAQLAIIDDGGAISGRVTGPDGQDLGVYTVYVYDQSNNEIASAPTDAGGFYEVAPLAAGTYLVRFPSANGLKEQWYNGKADFETADGVAVTIGQTTTGINAQLAALGRIQGRVADHRGVALPGIQVSAYAPDGNQLDTAETDPQGNYEITSLPEGTCKVKFSDTNHNIYIEEYYNDKKDFAGADLVTVHEGQTTQNIDAQLSLGGSITGQVTNEQGDWLQDIAISIVDGDGTTIRNAWTDELGIYEATGLAAGNFKVRFLDEMQGLYAQEWYNDKADFTAADNVTVAISQLTSGIDAQLVEGGAIEGRVTGTGNAGLSGVLVKIYDQAHNPVRESFTQQGGDYSITGLATGAYRVEFFPAEDGQGFYAGEWYNDKAGFTTADNVMVTNRQTTSGIDAQLAEAGKITGRVTGPENQGLLQITVQVYDQTETLVRETTTLGEETEEDGDYIIAGLETGKYKVRFFDNYERRYIEEWYNDKTNFTAADNITVTIGQITSGIDGQLTEAGKITGRVTGAGGTDGLGGVQISVYDAGSNLIATSSTAADGAYTVFGLPTGVYTVFFSEPVTNTNQWYNNKSSSGAADPVSVTIGQTTAGIDAQLAVSAISGRVTDLEGHGVSDVNVEVYSDPGHTVQGSTLTGADGRYAICLPAGAYKVFFGSAYIVGVWYNNQADFDDANSVVVQSGLVVTV